jgi:DNA processing protein
MYIIDIWDDLYPKCLFGVDDPPEKLYCAGNVDILAQNKIAIIGSRDCDFDVDTIKIDAIIKKFYQIDKDIKVVSGLAKGIDSIAHQKSLENGTIAILGTGLDVIYPNANEDLYNRILENNGLIISEYPNGSRPLPKNFIKRNRIIAGLASSIIAIRCNAKSGTFSTINYGLKYGKNVYCVRSGEGFNDSLIDKQVVRELLI